MDNLGIARSELQRALGELAAAQTLIYGATDKINEAQTAVRTARIITPVDAINAITGMTDDVLTQAHHVVTQIAAIIAKIDEFCG